MRRAVDGETGAWCKGLAHVCPAPCRVCDWIFLCLGFLMGKVGVTVIAPASQDRCEDDVSRVCCYLVFALFLVTSEETEALRGEASP